MTSVTGQMSDVELDAVDRQMVDELVRDGRLSINELAKRVNVARATAYSRLDRLLERGVITGFRAEVDPTAVGRPMAALVLLDIDQHDWPHALPALAGLTGVEYVALTAGDFDIAMLVRVADVAELRSMLLERVQSLPEVRSTKTVFILDEVRNPLDVGVAPRSAPGV